jgi:putative SOS response-associated peptidase YedK
MCGRFTLTNPNLLAEHFKLDQKPLLEPRYNIAPTQQVAVIRSQDSGRFKLSMMRWGLIPHWSKDDKISYKLINARAETVAEKPTFRSAFKARRCLIPADGFYEWEHNGKNKQPYYVRMKRRGLFAFAGLWEYWTGPDGKVRESCCIITTDANSLIQKIHDRMPAVIDPEQYALWSGEMMSSTMLQQLLEPFEPEKMTAFPVSGMVNSPKNDIPDCIKKATERNG